MRVSIPENSIRLLLRSAKIPITAVLNVFSPAGRHDPEHSEIQLSADWSFREFRDWKTSRILRGFPPRRETFGQRVEVDINVSFVSELYSYDRHIWSIRDSCYRHHPPVFFGPFISCRKTCIMREDLQLFGFGCFPFQLTVISMQFRSRIGQGNLENVWHPP